MKVTKKLIDDTVRLYQIWQASKKEAERAEKVWKEKVAPIIEYMNDDLRLPPDHAAELKGHHTMLKVGKQREIRMLTDPVQALRLLEQREKGLGYANITIKMEVLEANLPLPDYEPLLKVKYGSRMVKGVDLTEP